MIIAKDKMSLDSLIIDMMRMGGEDPAIRFNEKGRDYVLSFSDLNKKVQALTGWM